MQALVVMLVVTLAACGDDGSSADVGVGDSAMMDSAMMDAVADANGDAADSGVTADAADTSTRSDGGAGDWWRPSPGVSWQWQLSGALDTSLDVEMYDIDLFDTPQATIDALHADGRVVICYFSAGSYEEWRDDAGDFPAGALGNPLDGWPGERWLDVRDAGVRAIMAARLDLAVTKGCDGVEPDNVDGYQNDSGFSLSATDQLDFNRFLSTEAHGRGLSVGLKNDLDQITALVAEFDWALDEECVEYDECDALVPFIDAGKAVFHVEYGGAGAATRVCAVTQPLGFDTLIKRLELDAFRVTCP